MADFNFTCFLYGGCCIVIGVIYRFFPPKKYSRFNGVQLKAALRNEHTWHESNRFIATPLLITGLAFLLAGVVLGPIVQIKYLSFHLAILAVCISALTSTALLNRHLKKVFDNEGNRIKDM